MDAKKLSNALTRWGAFRVNGWLERQVQKGRADAMWLKVVRDFQRILEETYPGNWDIHTKVVIDRSTEIVYDENGKAIDYKNCHKIKLTFVPIIRFPEIEIRNSRNDTHTIKDLFIKVPVSIVNNKVIVGKILGMRATVTIGEYNYNYWHSHLSIACSTQGMNFSNFCLGAGEILQTMAELNARYSVDLLQLVVLQIGTVAGWESLEGTPYRKINRIGSVSQDILQRLNNNHIEAYGYDTKIINNIKDKKIKLNWVLKEGKPRIVDDETFEDALMWLGQTGHYANVLCTKDDTGKYYPNSGTTAVIKATNDVFIFRGKEVKMKIEGLSEHVQVVKPKLYIHPDIKNYVKRKLEWEAHINQIRIGFTRLLEAESSS